MESQVKVAVRLRPLLKSDNDRSFWTIDRNRITQINSSNTFQFDHLFDEKSTTDDIYNSICSPMLKSYIDGFNATIFVYGQTASGKSFTMLGDGTDECKSLGILPLSLFEMFNIFSEQPNREFLLSASYMEIYNEKITDLLDPNSDSVKIREDKTGSVVVCGLTEVPCKNIDGIVEVLSAGNVNRTIGETNFNLRSSRSHTIFTLLLESRDALHEDSSAKVSTLHLIDLAGSERPSAATNESQRFKEGTYINSSLLALGNVISSLAEGRSHVPYRDSKLTRILQSSLGGNAKTLIVCTVSPTSIDETVSTLRFASRAMKVKNKPVINEVITREQALKQQVSLLTKENTLLNAKLKESCQDKERKELLAKIQALEDQRDEAEKEVVVLKKHLSKHVISGQSVTDNSDDTHTLVNRRKTYLIEQHPTTPITTKDDYFSSPCLTQSDRRKTMFLSRPKDVTFILRRSPIQEDDDVTPAKTLIFEEPSSITKETVNTQTNTDDVILCNVFTQTQSHVDEDSSIEAKQQSLTGHISRSGHCVFSDLNQSYLCKHRTEATSAFSELENAAFLNDEFLIRLEEMEQELKEKGNLVKLIEKKLHDREEANKAQEEMLILLQSKLKSAKSESQAFQEKLRQLQSVNVSDHSETVETESLTAQLKATDQLLKNKTVLLDEAEERIIVLEKTCNLMKENETRNNKKFSQMVEEEQLLRHKLTELHKKFNKLEVQLEHSTRQCNNETQKENAQLAETLKSELDSMETTLKGKDELLNTLTKKVAMLEDKVKHQNEILDKYIGIENELQESECHNLDLTNEVSQLKSHNESLTNELNGLKEIMKHDEEILDKYIGIEDELRDAECLNTDLTEEVSQLKSHNESLTNELNGLKEKMKHDEEILDKYIGIEDELRDAECLNTDLTEEVSQLKSHNQSLTNELSELKEKMKHDEEILDKYIGIEDELRDAECLNTDLTEEVTKLTNTVKTLTDEVNVLKDKLIWTEETLDKYFGIESELQDVECQNIDLTEEVSQLKSHNENLTRELSELKQKMKHEEMKCDEDVTKLTNTKNLTDELNVLKDKLIWTEETLDKYFGIESELQNAECQNLDLTEEVDKLKNTLQLKMAEVAKMESQISNLLTENTTLKKTVEELKDAKPKQQLGSVPMGMGMGLGMGMGVPPQEVLSTLQEITALKKERKELISKIRFLSYNIAISPSTGRVYNSEIARYEELAEKMEAKINSNKEKMKFLQTKMFQYREERNQLRMKLDAAEQADQPPISDKDSTLTDSTVTLDIPSSKCTTKHSSISDNIKESTIKNNAVSDIPSSECSTNATASENIKLEKEHVSSVENSLPKEYIGVPEEFWPGPVRRGEGDVRRSKNNPYLYGWDWEQSIAEDPENVGKLPFNVYEKTPTKPPSHPSQCQHQ